ncbi:AAC(3) family N-acetyltransferase [Streptomyces sp. NPDC002952]|uniref:AAC(3) family N-acetyltransferase n=1 Tax=Streptomyces sp. NPDC002952 TaxID=3364673 RepID=UPI00368407FC
MTPAANIPRVGRSSAEPVPRVIDPATFADLARARGGARAVAQLGAGQFSKRMLLADALRRTAAAGPPAVAAEVAGMYERLVDLNRRDRRAWHAVMMHPFIDEGLARALGALDRGEHPELGWLEDLLDGTRQGKWPVVRTVCDEQVLQLWLADSGSLRDAHGHALTEPLDDKQVLRWQEALEGAWEILVRRHPWHAEAVGACIQALVPLCPGTDGTAVSSAPRRAYGAIAASLPDDPVLLALTLVHEFLHVQLGALLDLVPLHGPPSDARYHASWRPDPRPAGALLRGTYAHLGVTDFWRSELAAGMGGERARHEYGTRRGHTEDAAATLLDSGELLPAGERFVQGVREAVRREPVVTSRLRERHELVDELRQLGLSTGDTVLVHASLHALGPVRGGVDTVVDALRDVLGPTGTLTVYTQTPDNSDPSRWPGTRGYAVPKETWDSERDKVPAFDPARSPSFGVGVLSERVWRQDGAMRSAHPQSSFAALGAEAAYVTADHAPDCHLGEDSPLARLEKLDARVLLLGVGYDVCTAFHLAEYRVPGRPRNTYSCVVAAPPPQGRRWYRYRDVLLDSSPFGELGAAYEATGAVRRGRVGSADARLFGLAPAVAHAVEWLKAGGSNSTES